MCRVQLFGLFILRQIEVELTDVRNISHQGTGEGSPHPAATDSEPNLLAHRLSHNHVAAALARKVDQSTLAHKNSAIGICCGRREARSAGRLEPIVRRAYHVSGTVG